MFLPDQNTITGTYEDIIGASLMTTIAMSECMRRNLAAECPR
jgi:hypothetical protein